MKIAFISPEVVPFAKTGGLADVSGILPDTLNTLGHKCFIVMPFYQLVRKNGFKPKSIKSDINLRLGPREFKFTLRLLKHNKTDVYFIDNPELYDREQLYGTPQGDYPDSAIRFAFFAKAALYVVDYLGGVDVIHSNDWQSALIPLYLKLLPNRRGDRRIKTLFTIHNMAYQGSFDYNLMPSIDLPTELFTPEALEFYGKVNFMKAGIIYSDAINTVSKGYAKEILTPEFSCGLDGLLRTRASALHGIVNGANYGEWNPETDKYIIENYNEKTLDKKIACKKDLLKSFGFTFSDKKPVIGMVTRLAEQKGIDLVAECIEQMLSLGTYFVLLGTGDEKYNNLFRNIAKKHKNSVGVKIAFDNALAHKIEAGCDMFLMPSRYEPCGLNQLYSLKYGTVPIVRATGGLDDTIENFNPTTNKGNGFKFTDTSSQALYATVKKAVTLYKDKKKWRTLQINGIKCDFSWKNSAQKYVELYNKVLKKGRL